LDTNALLWQFASKVDIEMELNRLLGGYEIVIPSSVLAELDHVSDRYAKAAIKFTERYRVVPTELKGDDSIVELAKSLQAMVLTNDKELRHRLKEQGTTVIFMRQGKYLAMDRP